jgi:NOL1/NOP2/fmu family ribosome biogenesis protein
MNEVEIFLSSLEDRFGIQKESFRKYHLFSRSNDIWCVTNEASDAEFKHVIRKGIRIARVFPHSVRPTTNAIQLLGHLVTKNSLELDEKATRLFLAGKTLEIKNIVDVSDGFVVAFYKRYALGIGLLKGSKLKSQVPRSRRILG